MKKNLIFLFACLFFCACEKQETQVFVIYATGDISGYYWPSLREERYEREAGGFAILKKLISHERRPYVLLDTGNWFAGTGEGILDKGKFAVNMMNNIGYSLSSVGQKEIEAGLEMDPAFKAAMFPLLLSNIKSENKFFSNRHILERSGVKFGLLSLIPPTTEFVSERVSARFGPEIETAKQAVAALKNDGADIVVLLLNSSMESSVYPAAQLAEEIEGLNIIISSAEPDEDESEFYKKDSTYIAHVKPLLGDVLKINLFITPDKTLVNAEGEQQALFEDEYGADEEIKKLTDNFRSAAKRKLNYVITETESGLNAERDGASELGSFIAQCIKDWLKADVAVINSKSMSGPLKAGGVTDYNLYEIYPYQDTVMSVRFRGAALKNMLEGALVSAGNFPQVAGLEVEYSPPAPPYKKIKTIKINGSPVRAENIYRMATTDHITAGGFGTEDFIDVVEFKNTYVDIRTVMRGCFSRHKKLTSPKLPKWTVVE